MICYRRIVHEWRERKSSSQGINSWLVDIFSECIMWSTLRPNKWVLGLTWVSLARVNWKSKSKSSGLRSHSSAHASENSGPCTWCSLFLSTLSSLCSKLLRETCGWYAEVGSNATSASSILGSFSLSICLARSLDVMQSPMAIVGIFLCLFIHLTIVSAGDSKEETYNKTCNSDLQSGELFLTYSLDNFGCIVDCVIFTSSSKRQQEFLDRSERRRHLLSNIVCLNDSYVSNKCVCLLPPHWKGFLWKGDFGVCAMTHDPQMV